jgi:xylulokinase
MKRYLMGFGIGTLSSKAVLTDLSGTIIAKRQMEHAIEIKHPGWQEESMEMWWEEFKEAAAYFLGLEDIQKDQIKAIGITGLIPAMCAVDYGGNPVRNAILHTDVRAEKELQEINEKLECKISHGHMLPKILWVKRHEPENYKRIHKIMVPHGYIGFKLTENATMDYDSATMAGGLFRERSLDWDEGTIRAFGLESYVFPDVYPASHINGQICEFAAEETGLSQDTKVIVGVGDTFASMLGGGAYNAGHFMLYLGTSGTSIYAENSPEHYITIPHYGEGKGHFTGRIFSFGESILHLRNNLGYDSWEALNSHLEEIPPGSEGLWYFPHYKLQTEASFFGPDAEFMLGYRGCHSQFHLYHAMLEGIAYNARYNISGLDLPIHRINMFGGGTNAREICQLFSDVIGRELYYNPKSSTALGIAFLAGYGSGLIERYDTLEKSWLSDSIAVKPDEEKSRQYHGLYEKYQELRSRLMKLDSEIENVQE